MGEGSFAFKSGIALTWGLPLGTVREKTGRLQILSIPYFMTPDYFYHDLLGFGT